MLKKIGIILLVFITIGAAVAYWGYNTVFAPNTAFSEQQQILKLRPGSSYEDVKNKLLRKNIVSDIESLDRVAGWMKYKKDEVPAGLYTIKKGWNNKQIISMLRSGNQTPISVTFNNVRTADELAGQITKDLALDSASLAQYFDRSEVSFKAGLTGKTMMTLFIPNTYSLFWDISEEELIARMQREHDTFWSKNDRMTKAKALDMTPAEVYTLASIVEKESQHGPERPIIAGLYLNRLKKGIALQADPTVVYANGDFGLRRVLNKHLEFDSPYNTYKYSGLPPGPIYMPSIQSIDAVLNYDKHDYLYMCAKPGYGTEHAFAKTLRGHNENANQYRSWLNTQGIR